MACSSRYSKKGTPMFTLGWHSDDGSSFVISDTGTEEVDNEIRRICFGRTGRARSGSSQGEETEMEERQSRGQTSTGAYFRSYSEPWNQWTQLPMRRKKATILQYFSYAKSFKIITVKTNEEDTAKCCFFAQATRVTEMQITDFDGCPLFDAWIQRSPWPSSNCRWILEACGNLILTIEQSESVSALDKHASSQVSISTKNFFPSPNKDTSKMTCRRWSVMDWNGDRFGYLVASGTGEAVFLENADKETVGKFLRQCTLSRRLRSDNSADFTDDFCRIRTPIVAKTSRRRVIRRNVRMEKNVTWTCVHQESEQKLARIENDHVIFSNVNINLATKLLILAGIVKIFGDLQHVAISEYSCALFSDGRR